MFVGAIPKYRLRLQPKNPAPIGFGSITLIDRQLLKTIVRIWIKITGIRFKYFFFSNSRSGEKFQTRIHNTDMSVDTGTYWVISINKIFWLCSVCQARPGVTWRWRWWWPRRRRPRPWCGRWWATLSGPSSSPASRWWQVSPPGPGIYLLHALNPEFAPHP